MHFLPQTQKLLVLCGSNFSTDGLNLWPSRYFGFQIPEAQASMANGKEFGGG